MKLRIVLYVIILIILSYYSLICYINFHVRLNRRPDYKDFEKPIIFERSNRTSHKYHNPYDNYE